MLLFLPRSRMGSGHWSHFRFTPYMLYEWGFELLWVTSFISNREMHICRTFSSPRACPLPWHASLNLGSLVLRLQWPWVSSMTLLSPSTGTLRSSETRRELTGGKKQSFGNIWWNHIFFRGVSRGIVLRLHIRKIDLRARYQMPNMKQTNNKSRLTNCRHDKNSAAAIIPLQCADGFQVRSLPGVNTSVC